MKHNMKHSKTKNDVPEYNNLSIRNTKIWKQFQREIKKSIQPDVHIPDFFPDTKGINLANFVSHYELYQLIQDLPGDIVECGVSHDISPFSFAKKHIEIFYALNFIPWSNRMFFLIDGDLCQTAPEFVNDNPNLQIAWLHLHVDADAPMFAALMAFYPSVVKGGVISFYGQSQLTAMENRLIWKNICGERIPTGRKLPFLSSWRFFIKE